MCEQNDRKDGSSYHTACTISAQPLFVFELPRGLPTNRGGPRDAQNCYSIPSFGDDRRLRRPSRPPPPGRIAPCWPENKPTVLSASASRHFGSETAKAWKYKLAGIIITGGGLKTPERGPSPSAQWHEVRYMAGTTRKHSERFAEMMTPLLAKKPDRVPHPDIFVMHKER